MLAAAKTRIATPHATWSSGREYSMNVIASIRMPRATETPIRIAMKVVMDAYGLDEYSAKPRIVPTMTNTLPSNDRMNAVSGRSSTHLPPPNSAECAYLTAPYIFGKYRTRIRMAGASENL